MTYKISTLSRKHVDKLDKRLKIGQFQSAFDLPAILVCRVCRRVSGGKTLGLEGSHEQ